MAALCVVIAACLWLQPPQTVVPASSTYDLETAFVSAGFHYVHAHDDAGHAENELEANPDATEPHAHYCGAAQAPHLADGIGIYIGEQASLDAGFAMEPSANISRLSSSLDRPPRLSAHV